MSFVDEDGIKYYDFRNPDDVAEYVRDRKIEQREAWR